MNRGSRGNNGPGLQFLIVDDCPDAGNILGLLLRRAGHQVEVLQDSTACFAHLELMRPDVLLLDIAMPRISGYALAKQIRARREFDTLVIIAVSGYADPQHSQWSLDAGCDRHLAKPVDVTALESAIASAAERRLRLSRKRAD